MANIDVNVIDGNNINLVVSPSATSTLVVESGFGAGVAMELYPAPTQVINIDRGVPGNGIASVSVIDIGGSQYLHITFTNGTSSDVGPIATSTYFGVSPIVVTGDQISLDVVPVSMGGTGQTTANSAFNALAPSQTGNSGKYLTTDGSNTSWATNPLGTVTSVAATVPDFLSINGSPITTSGTLEIGLSGTALPVLNGGTGTTTSTGSGSVVLSTSPTLTTPNLGTPSALVGTNITGTASGLTAGNVTTNANLTGAVTSVGNATSLGSFTSLQLATALTDETGTGPAVFGTSPTLSGPTIGGANPYAQFDNGAAVALAAGRFWYNGTTGSWNAGMGGGNITQQIGEELFVYGKASSAITDSPLRIVYQTGAVGSSGVITFGPTVEGITNGDLIIGVATESLALNAFGRATSYGIVRNITTDGSAYGETWADGDMIWYNPVTGNPTNVKPSAPNIKVSVGVLIKAGNGGSGSIQVEVNHGSVLGGTDSNVQLSAPTGGQMLSYDATASYWKNINLLSGAGISVTSSANGSITVANTGVTSVTATSPVASSGGATPAISLSAGYGDTLNPYASKTANHFLAAPNGSGGAPAFRAVVAADIPTLNQNTTGNAATATTATNVSGGTANVTTLTASQDSAFTSTGAVQLSSGTTAQRPTGAAGKLRFNTTTAEFEGYNGAAWASVGGSAISNDTSTATNLYPLFAAATTGTASSVYTSNAQYLFKPSTGELSVKALRASNGIVANSATISSNCTIATGDNAMSTGPITINSGVAVTVSSGSVWVVL